MMEFMMIFGVIMMAMVVIVGNIALVESSNTATMINQETGFILVDRNEVDLVGVDFGKFKQR